MTDTAEIKAQSCIVMLLVDPNKRFHYAIVHTSPVEWMRMGNKYSIRFWRRTEQTFDLKVVGKKEDLFFIHDTTP